MTDCCPTFTIRQFDTLPVLTVTLENNGEAVDLTDATGVDFIMWSVIDGEVAQQANGAATIIDATAGRVSFTFTSDNTQNAGTFLAVFRVSFSPTEILTVPTNGTITVYIPPTAVPPLP